jgi:hypothetical protein
MRIYYKMIGGRKVRSNKGKKRTPYGPRSRTRSGAKFRGINVSRKNNKSRKTRKVRSNKGKKRAPYGRYNSSGRTRSDVRRERPSWLLFARKGKKFSV